MPIVTVQQLPKTVEQRQDLVARITQAFVDAYGNAPDTVQVWFHEAAADAVGMAGRLVGG